MWEQNELVIREQHNQFLREVAKYQLEQEALRARRTTGAKHGLLTALVERFAAGRKPQVAPNREWRTRKI